MVEGPRKQNGLGEGGAEAGAGVAEGSPKRLVQTLTGVPTELLKPTCVFVVLLCFHGPTGIEIDLNLLENIR